MRINILFTLVLSWLAAGCGAEDDANGQSTMPETTANSPVAAERGGTIIVGEDSWTLVPAVQCSVYPGDVVSIAGHAAEDPSLEITIDYGGPNQLVIGSGRDALWYAKQDTIQIEIEGKRVRGTATFTQYSSGTGESREGSFYVQC
jgi:hypothetical protein